MTQKPRDLTALISSRICHDLISPLGAIGNGVELLEMGNAANGPEMALVRDSVINANAKVRYFRVAYGDCVVGQQIRAQELGEIIRDYAGQSRVSIDWQSDESPRRIEAKLALLLLQCLETSMPYGGNIKFGLDRGKWQIHAKSDRMKIDPALWQLISEDNPEIEIAASQVQFTLIPATLKAAGKTLSAEFHECEIKITF